MLNVFQVQMKNVILVIQNRMNFVMLVMKDIIYLKMIKPKYKKFETDGDDINYPE